MRDDNALPDGSASPPVPVTARLDTVAGLYPLDHSLAEIIRSWRARAAGLFHSYQCAHERAEESVPNAEK